MSSLLRARGGLGGESAGGLAWEDVRARGIQPGGVERPILVAHCADTCSSSHVYNIFLGNAMRLNLKKKNVRVPS